MTESMDVATQAPSATVRAIIRWRLPRLVRAPRSIRKNTREPYFAKTEAEASRAEIGTVSVPLETL